MSGQYDEEISTKSCSNTFYYTDKCTRTSTFYTYTTSTLSSYNSNQNYLSSGFRIKKTSSLTYTQNQTVSWAHTRLGSYDNDLSIMNNGITYSYRNYDDEVERDDLVYKGTYYNTSESKTKFKTIYMPIECSTSTNESFYFTKYETGPRFWFSDTNGTTYRPVFNNLSFVGYTSDIAKTSLFISTIGTSSLSSTSTIYNTATEPKLFYPFYIKDTTMSTWGYDSLITEVNTLTLQLSCDMSSNYTYSLTNNTLVHNETITNKFHASFNSFEEEYTTAYNYNTIHVQDIVSNQYIINVKYHTKLITSNYVRFDNDFVNDVKNFTYTYRDELAQLHIKRVFYYKSLCNRLYYTLSNTRSITVGASRIGYTTGATHHTEASYNWNVYSIKQINNNINANNCYSETVTRGSVFTTYVYSKASEIVCRNTNSFNSLLTVLYSVNSACNVTSKTSIVSNTYLSNWMTIKNSYMDEEVFNQGGSYWVELNTMGNRVGLITAKPDVKCDLVIKGNWLNPNALYYSMDSESNYTLSYNSAYTSKLYTLQGMLYSDMITKPFVKLETTNITSLGSYTCLNIQGNTCTCTITTTSLPQLMTDNIYFRGMTLNTDN